MTTYIDALQTIHVRLTSDHASLGGTVLCYFKPLIMLWSVRFQHREIKWWFSPLYKRAWSSWLDCNLLIWVIQFKSGLINLSFLSKLNLTSIGIKGFGMPLYFCLISNKNPSLRLQWNSPQLNIKYLPLINLT